LSPGDDIRRNRHQAESPGGSTAPERSAQGERAPKVLRYSDLQLQISMGGDGSLQFTSRETKGSETKIRRRELQIPAGRRSTWKSNDLRANRRSSCTAGRAYTRGGKPCGVKKNEGGAEPGFSKTGRRSQRGRFSDAASETCLAAKVLPDQDDRRGWEGTPAERRDRCLSAALRIPDEEFSR